MALDYDPRRDMLMAFATPIAQMRIAECDEINPGLRRAILENEVANPGNSRSNVGGWHSSDDLLDWPQAEFAVLKSSFEAAARNMMTVIAGGKPFEIEMALSSWANVSRHGSYHQPHSHARNHWSGVYYVDAGHPDPKWHKSGQIELQDPRERAEMAATPLNPFGRTVAVPARAGMMVVFPSWLTHWVNPYYGEGERISIAFNARIDQFQVQGG